MLSLSQNERKFVWHSLGQNPMTISIKNDRKLISGASQSRICSIFIQMLTENEKKLIWRGPKQNLIDFYINFN